MKEIMLVFPCFPGSILSRCQPVSHRTVSLFPCYVLILLSFQILTIQPAMQKPLCCLHSQSPDLSPPTCSHVPISPVGFIPLFDHLLCFCLSIPANLSICLSFARYDPHLPFEHMLANLIPYWTNLSHLPYRLGFACYLWETSLRVKPESYILIIHNIFIFYTQAQV